MHTFHLHIYILYNTPGNSAHTMETRERESERERKRDLERERKNIFTWRAQPSTMETGERERQRKRKREQEREEEAHRHLEGKDSPAGWRPEMLLNNHI